VPTNIEIPLDLPEVCIVKTEMGQREIVITVESTREKATDYLVSEPRDMGPTTRVPKEPKLVE
jgi:hypothetical protein